MKQLEISSTQIHKPPKQHTFISRTSNLNAKTPKHNQSLQQVSSIAVNNQQLQYELAIYEWRTKTQFPIVKISHLKVLEKKANRSILEIRKQKYRFILRNCKQLPLFKVLYLLKESIIGFQRLYNKFGSFLVTPNMIAIDNSQKCRVWINQNYASNSYIQLKLNQTTFLSEIYRVFEVKSNHLKNTGHFYHQLKTCKTFCEALNLIQNFSKENKIIISTSCKITAQQILEQKKQQDFNFSVSLSINKQSNFLPLFGLRISLKTNSANPLKKDRKTTTETFQNSEKDYISFVLNQKKQTTEATTQEASSMKSISNDPERVDRNKDFQIQQKFKDTIYKSQLPISVNTPEKSKCFVRKCNSNSIVIKQLSKQLKTEKNFNNHEISFKQKTQKVAKTYEDIHDEEDQQMTKNKIQNTFLKNKWNKKINGLLQGGDLKHSIINTQEKVRTKMTPVKLQLLGKITNNVYQSFIKAEHIVFNQSEPQTSEY